MKKLIFALSCLCFPGCIPVFIYGTGAHYKTMDVNPVYENLALMGDGRDNLFECNLKVNSCQQIFPGKKIASARYSKEGNIMATMVKKEHISEHLPPSILYLVAIVATPLVSSENSMPSSLQDRDSKPASEANPTTEIVH